MTNYALSTSNQQIIVAKHIHNNGSINRYEAEALGVCHLAARIYELKEKGIKFNWIDQPVNDPHNIKHEGIRRYSFNYGAMTQEQIEKLSKLLGKP